MEERIKNVMAQLFGVAPESITPSSSPETISRWDSLGHMNLCAALEEEFKVEFDTDQVVGMTNYKAVVEAVGRLVA
jgi:acyl carrier protein